MVTKAVMSFVIKIVVTIIFIFCFAVPAYEYILKYITLIDAKQTKAVIAELAKMNVMNKVSSVLVVNSKNFHTLYLTASFSLYLLVISITSKILKFCLKESSMSYDQSM